MPARSVHVISSSLVLLALAGCGHISFYDNQGLRGEEIGVKFYTPKPYLLVTRTQAKEAPIKAEIIYLPDLAHPIYAKAVAGMGSSNLSMTFSNGVLTTFGQNTDLKIPETVKEIGGLATGLGGLLATQVTGAKKGAPEPAEQPVVTLYEIDNSSGTTVLREVKPTQ